MNAELRRLIRFALVGVTNTAVTLASYTLLTAVGIPAAPASAIAFGLGAVNGYRLNRGWTFGTHGGPAVAARYVVVQGIGAGLSAAGVALLTHAGLHHLAAEVLVLPVVTLTTYVLARTIVFGPGMRTT